MAVHLQSSLFDQEDEVSTRPLHGIRRTDLGHGAWIDVLPQWLRGADTLFAALVRDVGWRAEQRVMYERVVAVPRLLAFFVSATPLPHPALEAARTELSRHYAAELGEPFTTAGLCLYRDGRDGVAWHGDTATGAAPRTPWSRSSPWEPLGTWRSGRASPAPPPSAGGSATAT